MADPTGTELKDGTKVSLGNNAGSLTVKRGPDNKVTLTYFDANGTQQGTFEKTMVPGEKISFGRQAPDGNTPTPGKFSVPNPQSQLSRNAAEITLTGDGRLVYTDVSSMNEGKRLNAPTFQQPDAPPAPQGRQQSLNLDARDGTPAHDATQKALLDRAEVAMKNYEAALRSTNPAAADGFHKRVEEAGGYKKLFTKLDGNLGLRDQAVIINGINDVSTRALEGDASARRAFTEYNQKTMRDSPLAHYNMLGGASAVTYNTAMSPTGSNPNITPDEAMKQMVSGKPLASNGDPLAVPADALVKPVEAQKPSVTAPPKQEPVKQEPVKQESPKQEPSTPPPAEKAPKSPWTKNQQGQFTASFDSPQEFDAALRKLTENGNSFSKGDFKPDHNKHTITLAPKFTELPSYLGPPPAAPPAPSVSSAPPGKSSWAKNEQGQFTAKFNSTEEFDAALKKLVQEGNTVSKGDFKADHNKNTITLAPKFTELPPYLAPPPAAVPPVAPQVTKPAPGAEPVQPAQKSASETETTVKPPATNPPGPSPELEKARAKQIKDNPDWFDANGKPVKDPEAAALKQNIKEKIASGSAGKWSVDLTDGKGNPTGEKVTTAKFIGTPSEMAALQQQLSDNGIETRMSTEGNAKGLRVASNSMETFRQKFLDGKQLSELPPLNTPQAVAKLSPGYTGSVPNVKPGGQNTANLRGEGPLWEDPANGTSRKEARKNVDIGKRPVMTETPPAPPPAAPPAPEPTKTTMPPEVKTTGPEVKPAAVTEPTGQKPSVAPAEGAVNKSMRAATALSGANKVQEGLQKGDNADVAIGGLELASSVSRKAGPLGVVAGAVGDVKRIAEQAEKITDPAEKAKFIARESEAAATDTVANFATVGMAGKAASISNKGDEELKKNAAKLFADAVSTKMSSEELQNRLRDMGAKYVQNKIDALDASTPGQIRANLIEMEKELSLTRDLKQQAAATNAATFAPGTTPAYNDKEWRDKPSADRPMPRPEEYKFGADAVRMLKERYKNEIGTKLDGPSPDPRVMNQYIDRYVAELKEQDKRPENVAPNSFGQHVKQTFKDAAEMGKDVVGRDNKAENEKDAIATKLQKLQSFQKSLNGDLPLNPDGTRQQGYRERFDTVESGKKNKEAMDLEDRANKAKIAQMQKEMEATRKTEGARMQAQNDAMKDQLKKGQQESQDIEDQFAKQKEKLLSTESNRTSTKNELVRELQALQKMTPDEREAYFRANAQKNKALGVSDVRDSLTRTTPENLQERAKYAGVNVEEHFPDAAKSVPGKAANAPDKPKQSTADAVKELDKDGDGKITAKDLVKGFDANGDGKVDKDDFKNAQGAVDEKKVSEFQKTAAKLQELAKTDAKFAGALEAAKKMAKDANIKLDGVQVAAVVAPGTQFVNSTGPKPKSIA